MMGGISASDFSIIQGKYRGKARCGDIATFPTYIAGFPHYVAAFPIDVAGFPTD
jgi:hypothetical protein